MDENEKELAQMWAESPRLCRVYETVVDGVETVARGMRAIRDGELYRPDYESFDAYAREIWDISVAEAEVVIASLGPFEADDAQTEAQAYADAVIKAVRLLWPQAVGILGM